jgi:1-acyl-sn-glycerol-3-phosphate acyltransferase
MQQKLQHGIWQSGRFILRTWFDLSWEGTEHLPAPPYLLASNHVSHLDGPAIIAAHGRHLRAVHSLAAQDYFFDHALKGWLFQTLFNMIPFQRRRFFRDCLPACRSVLAQNKAILMFPEGTRSQTGKLQPFKSGLGFLALELGVPIVPVYIAGSYQALPKGGRFLPQRHPIHVSFGQPIEITTYQQRQSEQANRDLYKAVVQEVRLAIEQLQDKLSEPASQQAIERQPESLSRDTANG